MERIVVGVDGSQSSHDALRWALQHAGSRGGELHVVHVYGSDGTASPYLASYANADPKTAARLTASDTRWREQQHARAQEQAQRVVAGVVADVEGEDVSTTVKTEVIAGKRPAQALIERSRDADLLVVGSRGGGGFRGLLLGSVSQQCVQHAPCTVVVVRPSSAAV